MVPESPTATNRPPVQVTAFSRAALWRTFR